MTIRPADASLISAATFSPAPAYGTAMMTTLASTIAATLLSAAHAPISCAAARALSGEVAARVTWWPAPHERRAERLADVAGSDDGDLHGQVRSFPFK